MEELENSKIISQEISIDLSDSHSFKINPGRKNIFLKKKSDTNIKQKKIKNFIYISIILLLVLAIFFLNIDNKNIKNIKLYFTDCDNGILYDNNTEHFKKRAKPKISIVIPGYNMEKYITRSIRSVQNQSMKNIEIIIVDDCSSDDTSRIVKQHMKEDYRIIYIKNEENLSTYICRNKGILVSIGEFIQTLDADDLLIENILEIAYKAVTKLNIDIVEFPLVMRTNNKLEIENNKLKDKIYIQPELGDLKWYGKGTLTQANYRIYTKLIKKQTMLDTLQFLGEEFSKERIFLFEDTLLAFAVLRNGHSMKFIDQIGYYYWRGRMNSMMNSLEKVDKSELANNIIKSILTVAKFFYMKTKNNEHDKAIAFAFFDRHIDFGYPAVKIMTKGIELLKEVYDLYLYSPYLDSTKKEKLEKKFNIFQPSNNSQII